MSLEQHDYGNADNGRALVPGALTVFRHFSLNTRTRKLQPMNYTDPQAAFRNGYYFNEFERQRPYAPGTDGKVYEAECIRPRTLLGFADPRVPQEPHPAPRLDCSCGFYASYDPATDFYEGARWGPSWARERRNKYADLQELVLVRAVVEVTGAVVMGRKGVRAAKMKIIAVAVDHAKYLPPREEVVWEVRKPYDPHDYIDDSPLDPVIRYPHRETTSLRERRDADAVTEAVADAYGARFYPLAAEMYADYPPADVSALGVDTSPRWDDDDSWQRFVNGGIDFTSAVSQVQDAIDVTLKTISDAFKGVTPDAIIIDDEAFETPFERALRLKKNRPAPPGTGIDRRRGRLR